MNEVNRAFLVTVSQPGIAPKNEVQSVENYFSFQTTNIRDIDRAPAEKQSVYTKKYAGF